MIYSPIEVSNLRYSYRNGPFCLNVPHLLVDKCDFLNILGPNGSGKSTLLKLLSGIYRPDEGQISISGKDLGVLSYRERAKSMAFVPQIAGSLFPYTVYELVMMGRTAHFSYFGFEKPEDREIVLDSICRVQLSDFVYKNINDLSGGELQRAYIARALAQQSPVLLMDEPGSHLDIKQEISLYELLTDLNEKGKTILCISHNLNLSSCFGKKILLMKSGRIFAEGRTAEVMSRQNLREVFDLSPDSENYLRACL